MIPYGGRRHLEPVAGAPALEVRHLSVSYPGHRALSGVNACVPVGAQVALVGPNGAGKSSLLKAVAGLVPVQRGHVRVYGHPVGACHHRVAYLPQRGDLDWRFPVSVERLVMTGRYVHLGWFRRPRRGDREVVREALARVGLAGLAGRQIGRLSGGQQQRTLLARALAQEADLFLLDEPFNAVDAATRAALLALLGDLKAQGKTLLVATHDVDTLARDFDDVLQLLEGRLSPASAAPLRSVPRPRELVPVG